MSRAALWRDMPALITDYPFTGSGLGSTMMVYSTYVVLLHVGYITHAHNLFLQMAIEQGVPGLLAFVGLFLVIGWRLAARVDGRSQIFRLAAIASLVALVVHGTVDAGVYASRAVPILFLPFGFALAETVSQRSDRGPRPAVPPARHALRTAGLTPALVLTFAVVFALVMVLGLLPVSRAAFQANLGAAAQTRAELSLYQWPAWPIQDALRRSPVVDLVPAIAHYQAALALDPRNVAANRRLGQIELSRGQYDAARQHFETAFAAAPGQRATRQLLGESYAISGEVERAASLWQTVDIDQGQLTIRQWWYEHIGEAARAQSITEAAKLARPQD